MGTETNLCDLITDCEAFAEADEYFTDITVLSDRRTDITTEINKRIGTVTTKGGKIGVCVIILQPIADDEYPDLSNGPLGVEIAFRVLENVVLNSSSSGTGKAALSIATRLHRIFKNRTFGGRCHPLQPQKPCIVPIQDPLAPVAYEVRFLTREADLTTFSYVANPTITPSSGAAPQDLTLATATASASIYYTIDGSFPWSGNTAATLYSAPFNLAAAATVRVAAYKTGSIASDVIAAKFT